MDCLDSWFMKNLTVKQPAVKILCWHFVYYSSQYRSTRPQMKKNKKTLLTKQHPSIPWAFLTIPCDNFPLDIFRAWISRKRKKNTTFWLQFWRGFDASFSEQVPDLNYLYFCQFWIKIWFWQKNLVTFSAQLNRDLPKSTLCMNSWWLGTAEVSHKKAHFNL